MFSRGIERENRSKISLFHLFLILISGRYTLGGEREGGDWTKFEKGGGVGNVGWGVFIK